MNLYKSFALVLALFALACNFSTTAFAANAQESNNQPSEGRYLSTGDYTPIDKVGYKQPIFVGKDTLNGLGLKSAKELGIAGKKFYNEQEKSARVIILNPDAMVYYDTGSLEPMYLAGCLRDGKPFANRIKPLEPLQKAPEPKPVPVAVVTPTPAPVLTPTPAPKPVVVSKPTTNFVDKETGYDVRFEGGKGKIAVIPAIEVDETAVVVDIPKPTVRANGRVMSLGE